jgi:4-hydroxybenzoate polyprenyltransferase
MLGVTLACGTMAARRIGFAGVVAATLALLLLAAIAAAVRFWRAPEAGRGKIFELISGLWTLALYLSLGLVPLCWKQWK